MIRPALPFLHPDTRLLWPHTTLPGPRLHASLLMPQPGCGAALRDHILDWEDALPEDELELSGKVQEGKPHRLVAGISEAAKRQLLAAHC